MRRPRRPLGPEDVTLWSEVASTVRPLGRRRAHPVEPPAPPPQPAAPKPLPEPAPRHPLTPFEIASRARPEPKVHVATAKDATLRMDARAYMRMRRGKLAPEARIDLHGMTVAEAHSALIGFILRAHGAGLRLVLVITGKGKEGAGPGGRAGILRHQVPHWLHLPPLGPCVLQVAEAHASHGGGGALYVYLRRAG